MEAGQYEIIIFPSRSKLMTVCASLTMPWERHAIVQTQTIIAFVPELLEFVKKKRKIKHTKPTTHFLTQNKSDKPHQILFPLLPCAAAPVSVLTDPITGSQVHIYAHTHTHTHICIFQFTADVQNKINS